MGVRFGSALAGPLVTALPSNGANTIVCTTSILVTPHDSASIFLAYFVNILVGTGTNTVSLFVLRGGILSSPLVTPSFIAHSVTAGSTYMLSGSYVDVAFSGASQYSLMVNTSGTTGAGTLYDAALLAYIL